MHDSSSTLFLLCSQPYGRSRLRAGIDAILAFAVFSQQPRVLFSQDAVLALCPRAGDLTQRVGDLRKLIDSFPMYDVETIWVDEASLSVLGLASEHLPAFARLVTPEQRQNLVATAPAVLTY